MVAANELRIGNWIFIDNGERPKYEYQITAHDIEEIEGNGADCFPIPLTPEILEACGFTVTSYEGENAQLVMLYGSIYGSFNLASQEMSTDKIYPRKFKY